jgi:hypothetical protein
MRLPHHSSNSSGAGDLPGHFATAWNYGAPRRLVQGGLPSVFREIFPWFDWFRKYLANLYRVLARRMHYRRHGVSRQSGATFRREQCGRILGETWRNTENKDFTATSSRY